MKTASSARDRTGAGTGAGGDAPSGLIDAHIAALADWRGATLARLRALIREADPHVVETVKWRKPSNPNGVPVWEHAGILCTGETYRDKVKLTFARGAALADPAGLFNASLDAGTRRAIDIREGETIDAGGLQGAGAGSGEGERGVRRPTKPSATRSTTTFMRCRSTLCSTILCRRTSSTPHVTGDGRWRRGSPLVDERYRRARRCAGA